MEISWSMKLISSEGYHIFTGNKSMFFFKLVMIVFFVGEIMVLNVAMKKLKIFIFMVDENGFMA